MRKPRGSYFSLGRFQIEMRKLCLAILVSLGMAVAVSAQVTSPTQDVLGAHNVYGRGCVACHAPHSGAAGNGAPSSANSGNLALWGEDLTPLYGQTLAFGDGGEAIVNIPNYYPPSSGTVVNGVNPQGLPGSLHTANGGLFVIAACLSCHDGNIATSAMMKGTTVETVTINGAIFNPPTWLGNDGSTPGNYMNDHPVGPTANPGCEGPYNWDCSIDSTGHFVFDGTASAQFLQDYYDVTTYGPLAHLVTVPGTTSGYMGSIVSNSWITCTTCHDQHDMSYFRADNSGTIRPTHFFVRGWYDPGNSATSNSAAQFCRTCHGGESNEMHGQIVPTQ